MFKPFSIWFPQRTRLEPIPEVFSAVEDALKYVETDWKPERVSIRQLDPDEIEAEKASLRLRITVRDSNTPEYHADLASRMVADLARRAAVLDAEIIDLDETYERDRQERAESYAATRTAKVAELAGIRKTEAAYTGLASSLTAPAAPVDLGHGKFPGPDKAKPRGSRARDRQAFTIPPGHEAVRDAEGRATGKTRPIARVDNGTTGAVDMG